MAKLIDYDVRGVEESQGGTGVKIKPGVHPAQIVRCRQRDVKKDGTAANDIEVAFSFGDEFDWGFTYIGLSDAADWKLAEFVRALNLPDKGKINVEKIEEDKPVIRVKVNSGQYNGEYSPDIGRLMKAQPGDEELIGQSVSEISNRNGDGPDLEDSAAVAGDKFWREGLPDPENPDEIVGPYDDWSDEDLEAEVTDRDVTLPGGRASKRNKCIAALRANDEEYKSQEPPDDQAQAEASAGGDEYDNWDIDQLKTEWEARNFGDLPEIRGRGAADRLKTAIIEELRKDDEENPFAG